MGKKKKRAANYYYRYSNLPLSKCGGFGNELAKSIPFEQFCVELVKTVGTRAFGKDETTAFNAFLTMPRTQLRG
jgi:hypothetical protein